MKTFERPFEEGHSRRICLKPPWERKPWDDYVIYELSPPFTMKIFDQRVSYLEKLAGVKKEEVEEPKIGTPCWYLGEWGTKIRNTWQNFSHQKSARKIGNCFWEESDLDDELLRRESMTGRIAEPKREDEIWYWNFRENCAVSTYYNRCYFTNWLIGSVHFSKEDCKVWSEKYSKAFTKK